MRITILGSGTAAPRLNRNMSGYLLEAGAKKILLDSGAGTIRQLLKLKANLLDIDDIFYTHLHNDHINDLGAIIWSNNYGMKRNKPLNIYGPKSFKKYFNILMGKILRPAKLNYKIGIKEMWNGSIIRIPIKNNNSNIKLINKNTWTKSSTNFIGIENKNFLIIKSIKSKHTDASISYRIEYSNKSIVYSGDTDYSNEIIKLSKNADLLILECSHPNSMKTKGHLTPSLCGGIATKANAKKLVLTHFYPEADKVNIKGQCAKGFKGKIILAKDFMKIRA